MSNAHDFEILISSFVSKKIGPDEFENLFLEQFLRNNDVSDDRIYAILNSIFWNVEDFVSDPTLRDDGDLDEVELRSRCQASLPELRNLIRELELKKS